MPEWLLAGLIMLKLKL